MQNLARAPERDISALVKNKATGQQLKQRGFVRIESSCAGWLKAIVPHTKDWLKEHCCDVPTFTLEQFKAHSVAIELQQPPHHNAWGVLARRLASAGLIEWTGEFVSSRAPDAHARPVKLWRYLGDC